MYLQGKEREAIKMVNINNLPNYAMEYEFIVVRKCDDELWFYGAYDSCFTAYKVAEEIGNGIVCHNLRAH
jgi:hypothetical protein